MQFRCDSVLHLKIRVSQVLHLSRLNEPQPILIAYLLSASFNIAPSRPSPTVPSHSFSQGSWSYPFVRLAYSMTMHLLPALAPKKKSNCSVIQLQSSIWAFETCLQSTFVFRDFTSFKSNMGHIYWL